MRDITERLANERDLTRDGPLGHVLHDAETTIDALRKERDRFAHANREQAKELAALRERLAEAQEELAQWRATGESVTRNEHDLAARLSNLRKWVLEDHLLTEELEAIESGEWWENERD